MFNIVLFNPQIPHNTGAVGRLCVNSNVNLHLIKPLGFDISDKAVKRAGLDYWKYLEVFEYNNLNDFYSKHPVSNRHFFATTKTKQYYFDIKFKNNDYIFFGREDKGLPEELLNNNKETCINIPMINKARSLNLANAVSIIVYDIVRQNIQLFS